MNILKKSFLLICFLAFTGFAFAQNTAKDSNNLSNTGTSKQNSTKAKIQNSTANKIVLKSQKQQQPAQVKAKVLTLEQKAPVTIATKADKSAKKIATHNEIGLKISLGSYRDYISKRPLVSGYDGRTLMGTFGFLGQAANPNEYHSARGATLVRGKNLASSYYSAFNSSGGFYYIYTPEAGAGYKFDLSALVKYSVPIGGKSAGMDLLFQFDNSVFGNLIPNSIDYLRLDLGFTIRLYTGGLLINFLLYYDLEAKIPATGVVFNFTGNVGTLDIHNSDVKLSVAYEFGEEIKSGIEVGYQHLGQSAFVVDMNKLFSASDWNWNDKAISLDALFLGLYVKY